MDEIVYVDYRAAGTYALSSFVKFVIRRRKGIDSKRRKLLLTKFKKYDIIIDPDRRREGLLKIARALGGQKSFEEYMEYVTRHKII